MKKQTPTERVLAWSRLDAKQRNRFVESFLTKEAREVREAQLRTPRESSHCIYCSRVLNLYHSAIQKRRKQKDQICVLEIKLREMLKDWFIKALLSGDWDELAWLAKFGKAHCEKGLISHVGQTIPAYSLNNDEMGAVTLREFAQLSGASFDQLISPIEPLIPAPPSDGTYSSLMQQISHKSPPKLPTWIDSIGLPTKSLLREKTLGEWQRLTGAKPKAAESLFSRTIKKLGLAGLPDNRGNGKAFSSQQLSEEGEDLLESMRS